jgi:hypothetical protein
MAVIFHEVRIRDDGEILYIDMVGYLDYLPFTAIITENKEITIIKRWNFAKDLCEIPQMLGIILRAMFEHYVGISVVLILYYFPIY